MRRDILKRVSSLEHDMGVIGRDALRSAASHAEKLERIRAVVSRLEGWLKICRREFKRRGYPHNWREFQGLQTFTASVLKSTWISEENEHGFSAEEQRMLWLWDVLHMVYLARRFEGWGTLRIDPRMTPIESSLMAALLADGEEALADVEIARSQNSNTLPPRITLAELWGFTPSAPGGVA